jgi:polysaccharide export outer membrane protein
MGGERAVNGFAPEQGQGQTVKSSVKHIGKNDLRGRRLVWLLTTLVLAVSFGGRPAGASQGSASAGKVAPTQNQAAAAPAAADAMSQDDSYVIGPEDVLAINVWKEQEISRSVPVRMDGAISLPLVGEVQAGGKTPKQLEQEITKKLQTYISEPQVTVIVTEMRSKRFNVLGQVARPGSYLLTNSATVLDAIALAGGFRDFAKQKSIYVLRRNPDGSETRLPFNYKDVVKGKNTEQNVKLQPRDSVVVP